jgi:hypothetical protein
LLFVTITAPTLQCGVFQKEPGENNEEEGIIKGRGKSVSPKMPTYG